MEWNNKKLTDRDVEDILEEYLECHNLFDLLDMLEEGCMMDREDIMDYLDKSTDDIIEDYFDKNSASDILDQLDKEDIYDYLGEEAVSEIYNARVIRMSFERIVKSKTNLFPDKQTVKKVINELIEELW